MAAAAGPEDEAMDVDSDLYTAQNITPTRDQTVHRFQVKGLPPTDTSAAKLEKSIQTLCSLLKLGEVKRVSFGAEPGCLQVELTYSSVSKECFQNITVEIDGHPHQPFSSAAIHSQGLRGDGLEQNQLNQQLQGISGAVQSASQESQGSFSATEPAMEGQQHQGWPSASVSATKFNLLTGVQLNLSDVHPSLQGKVLDLITSHNLTRSSVPLNGSVLVEGPFEDVAHFRQAMIDLHSNVPSEQRPRRMQPGAEGGHGAVMETPDKKPDMAEEQSRDQLRLSLFHYEYLSKVCADKMAAVQERHQVDILPEVVLNVQAKGHRGVSSVRKAQEALTESIQPLIVDLGREKISASEAERPNVARAFREIREKKPLFTLTEWEEGCVITGPRSGLAQVKDELTDRLNLRARPRVTIKIQNEMTPTLTAMEIPKAHWELLENLFKKELESIKSKYKVEIEPWGQPTQTSVQVKVKNQPGSLDLSGNALQAFVLLYQKALTGFVALAVEGRHGDRVRVLYDEVRFTHPGVRLIPAEGGGLCLIGLPRNMESAVREIEKRFGGRVFSNLPRAVGGANGPSASSVGAPEAKAEASGGKDKEEDTCCICMDDFKDKITTKCKHSFCKGCWVQAMAVKPQCPVCKTAYGKIEGNQPAGTMTYTVNNAIHLPGFRDQCGSIKILYDIPSGIQSKDHPNPGQPYYGATRNAYLPNNTEGRQVLALLRKAFDQKLIFTVGESRTTGLKDTVTWNDIHHKTNTSGGPLSFGYPDSDYLKRVKEELQAKGIE